MSLVEIRDIFGLQGAVPNQVWAILLVLALLLGLLSISRALRAPLERHAAKLGIALMGLALLLIGALYITPARQSAGKKPEPPSPVDTIPAGDVAKTVRPIEVQKAPGDW